MGFEVSRYRLDSPLKATSFLRGLGYSRALTQSIIDRGRLRQDGEVLRKSSMIEKGLVELVEFRGRDLGLKPVFVMDSMKPSFCIFNKPAGLLTHPKNLENPGSNTGLPSLLEQLRYSFGAACNPCHRLDSETSGLVICALDRDSEIDIKGLFAKRQVSKEYLAVVRGRLDKAALIESNLAFERRGLGTLAIKGEARDLAIEALEASDLRRGFKGISPTFNKSLSVVMPLRRIEAGGLEAFLDSRLGRRVFARTPLDRGQPLGDYGLFARGLEAKAFEATLVRFLPITGKTHQLRIHAAALGNPILGDPLYGVDEGVASFFLDAKSKKGIDRRAATESTLSHFANHYISKPSLRLRILEDMRLFYTGSHRLLLHAHRIELLGKSFHAP